MLAKRREDQFRLLSRRRPPLNNMSDPISAIENKVRGASGGQDPGALRDAAASAVRAALSGDPAQKAAATDKAADALAKAQNIPADQAKAQMEEYQKQYADTVAKTKEQAKQAADTTAKTVSRGALFGVSCSYSVPWPHSLQGRPAR